MVYNKNSVDNSGSTFEMLVRHWNFTLDDKPNFEGVPMSANATQNKVKAYVDSKHTHNISHLFSRGWRENCTHAYKNDQGAAAITIGVDFPLQTSGALVTDVVVVDKNEDGVFYYTPSTEGNFTARVYIEDSGVGDDKGEYNITTIDFVVGLHKPELSGNCTRESETRTSLCTTATNDEEVRRNVDVAGTYAMVTGQPYLYPAIKLVDSETKSINQYTISCNDAIQPCSSADHHNISINNETGLLSATLDSEENVKVVVTAHDEYGGECILEIMTFQYKLPDTDASASEDNSDSGTIIAASFGQFIRHAPLFYTTTVFYSPLAGGCSSAARWRSFSLSCAWSPSYVL